MDSPMKGFTGRPFYLFPRCGLWSPLKLSELEFRALEILESERYFLHVAIIVSANLQCPLFLLDVRNIIVVPHKEEVVWREEAFNKLVHERFRIPWVYGGHAKLAGIHTRPLRVVLIIATENISRQGLRLLGV